MRSAVLILVLCILPFSWYGNVQAQVKQPEYSTQKPSVAVLARSKGDSVLIRWAPNDPLLWKAANQYGYRVVRIKVAESDQLLFGSSRTTIIVADSIRPYPIEKIEPLIEKDQYAAIVGQAIYGEDFEVSASFQKTPSDIINKSRELEDRFSFALFSADQSALAARVHGLLFVDKQVNINDKYLYVVYPLLPAGIMEFDTAYTVIAVNDTAQLPKPYDLKATFGDKYVELSWNREYLQRFYTSYMVERSDDNGNTYHVTTELPFLNISEADEQAEYFYRVDSLPENSRPYFFRVRGISPFGETGPPSDAVSGMGAGKSEFINPIITKNIIVDGSAAYLEWEIMEAFSKDIAGFEVSKSKSSEGLFTSITPVMLNKEVRSFTDTMPYKTGFYRVAAIDKTGERHYSFPAMVLLPDSLPPATPANFRGTVDSLGIVTLLWDANTEDDLRGYHVYRSNYADDGYVKINSEQIVTTAFHDTLSLRVLTKNVYYKIAAIDNHFNESELTEAKVITRPDTLPPAPPSFRNYVVSDSCILLFWNNSPSEDVEDHMLYRRKAGEDQWIRVNPVNDTTGMFIDKDITGQLVYQYLVIAVDHSGLESEPTNPISLRSSGSRGLHDNPIELKAWADAGGKAITINWSGHFSTDIIKVGLYRAVNDEPPVLFRTLPASDKSFTDENVQIGNSYTYRIQVISSVGTKSPLSSGVTLEF